MNRKQVLEQLLRAMAEMEVDFSCKDGSVTVGAITVNCLEEYLAVVMDQATNYFQYKTLRYIRGQGDHLRIVDTHYGVFSTYKVR